MNKNEYIPKKQSRIVLRWLLFFTALVVTFVIAFMYCTYLFWSVKSPDIIKFNSSYAIYILGICLTLIPLSLIIYPEVLYGIPNNKDSIFVKSSAPSKRSKNYILKKIQLNQLVIL